MKLKRGMREVFLINRVYQKRSDASVLYHNPGSFWPPQNMNQTIQQMEGAAVVALTESAVLSYICCINISSKPL